MTQFHPDPEPLSDFLAQTHLAPRQAHKLLTLWPLVRDPATRAPARAPKPLEYIALRTALARKAVQIDEVSDGGSVPHVCVTNTGNAAVLFLFGEEIRGAKQNRVANASFLAPGKSEVVLDVSCVEAGRWSRSRGARFESSAEVISPTLRRSMARQVTSSRASGGGFHACQSDVWDGIHQRIQYAGSESPTAAYSDYRESRASDLDEIGQAFHPVEGQVGFVACIGDEVIGLETIGRPDVFETDFPALLRAYAIDAVDAALVKQLEKRPGRRRRFSAPETFLAELSHTPFSRGESLGLGDDLRFESAAVAGCALVCGGLVHATAFPA